MLYVSHLGRHVGPQGDGDGGGKKGKEAKSFLDNEINKKRTRERGRTLAFGRRIIRMT